MSDLDREIVGLSKKLAEHRANAPETPTDNIGLLDHLPLVEVDLNELAADRLRRFLEAFRVQIHYDARTRRATLKAEVGAHLIEELARVANWGRPRPDQPESGGLHSSERCPPAGYNARLCKIGAVVPGHRRIRRRLRQRGGRPETQLDVDTCARSSGWVPRPRRPSRQQRRRREAPGATTGSSWPAFAPRPGDEGVTSRRARQQGVSFQPSRKLAVLPVRASTWR
jgi:hypothetical protein